YLGSQVVETPQGVFVRHNLSVTNNASFPDDLFFSTPRFGVCGQNPTPARTWVDVFDAGAEFGSPLNTFCALGGAQEMTGIWFPVPVGAAPPNSVVVQLTDRGCVGPEGAPRTYTSAPVLIPRQ